MKRLVVLLLMMTLLPCAVVFVGSLFLPGISIGNGGTSMTGIYMGKTVMIEVDGLYKNMDVEEYVLGVLPGTVAADYDEETLMTMAILIRTNVLKEMQEKNSSDAADLSYQYLSTEERKELFGKLHYERDERRFKRAVMDTAGLVIEQDGDLIMALYHEVSIGKTASAKELMGEDISYLQSVDSPQDVEAKHYMSIVVYSWEELENKLEIQKQDAENAKIEVTESSENGFVRQLTVNGQGMTGEEAMKQLKLPSTNFYIEQVDGGIRFVCLGKGNGMGLSVYGANRMAQQGKDYKQLIGYYYKGVTIVPYAP